MRRVIIAFDIGGTNVRAVVAPVSTHVAGAIPNAYAAAAPLVNQGGSKQALQRFVESVLNGLDAKDQVAAAVLAFAGPATPDSVRMTNWPEPREVTLGELEEAGLPLGRTRVVNDMAAGMTGVRALIEGAVETAFERVSDTGGMQTDEVPARVVTGNLVYIAPGTGLGAAALVGDLVVGCEAQHTPMPVFDDEIAPVAERLRYAAGRAPTWEEFVSGRGLTAIHSALIAPEGERLNVADVDASAARAIAGHAAEGVGSAVRAVELYYRCAARFAQFLTLALQPCAGVFFGGSSTIANRELLQASGFGRAFADNAVMDATLARTPVWIVLEEAVNLIGALAIAGELAKDTT